MLNMPTIDHKHTAKHCGPEYCHCMIPSSFIIPTPTSCMIFSNWWLPSGLPTSHTLNFIQPHRKESNGIKFDDWLGQVFGPPLLIHIPLKLSFRSSVTSRVKCWGSPLCCSHIHLQEPHPLSTAVCSLSIKKNSNRVVLKHPLIKCGPITLWPNTPSHMLTENSLCWQYRPR